jgi:hypothetical protein
MEGLMKWMFEKGLKSIALAACGMTAVAASSAGASDVPANDFGGFDHVFLIMMENETDLDIIRNANAPFINGYAHVANRAMEYYAVGHRQCPPMGLRRSVSCTISDKLA